MRGDELDAGELRGFSKDGREVPVRIEPTCRGDEREDVAGKVAPEATNADGPVGPTGDATGRRPVAMGRTADESASGLALSALVEPQRTDHGPRVRERFSDVARLVRPTGHVQPSASSNARNAASGSAENGRFFDSMAERFGWEEPIFAASSRCPSPCRFR